MTAEKKTLIHLSDIIAIDYGCPSCHTRFSVPIEEFQNPVAKCQNCKKDLIGVEGVAPDDLAIASFVRSLKELTNRAVGKVIRLEIEGMPEAKS
jgi:hypothetical protein